MNHQLKPTVLCCGPETTGDDDTGCCGTGCC